MEGSLTVITILPADKVFLQSVAAPDGVEAMVLRDSDDSVFGYALFRMAGKRVEILSVQTDLPVMAEGLIRSVLNTGDCRGAIEGFCAAERLAPMLRHLEFEPIEGGYVVSLEQFFRGECHCQ